MTFVSDKITDKNIKKYIFDMYTHILHILLFYFFNNFIKSNTY